MLPKCVLVAVDRVQLMQYSHEEVSAQVLPKAGLAMLRILVIAMVNVWITSSPVIPFAVKPSIAAMFQSNALVPVVLVLQIHLRQQVLNAKVV